MIAKSWRKYSTGAVYLMQINLAESGQTMSNQFPVNQISTF